MKQFLKFTSEYLIVTGFTLIALLIFGTNANALPGASSRQLGFSQNAEDIRILNFLKERRIISFENVIARNHNFSVGIDTYALNLNEYGIDQVIFVNPMNEDRAFIKIENRVYAIRLLVRPAQFNHFSRLPYFASTSSISNQDDESIRLVEDSRIYKSEWKKYSQESYAQTSFTKNGAYVMAKTFQGQTSIISASDGQSKWSANLSEGHTFCNALSPNSSELLTVNENRELSLIDLETGEAIRSSEALSNDTVDCEFSKRGDKFSVALRNGNIRLYETSTMRMLWEERNSGSNRDTAISIRFSPNNNWVTAVSRSGQIKTFEMESGETIWEVSLTTQGVIVDFQYSQNGEKILIPSHDIIILNARSGEVLNQFDVHHRGISSAYFNLTGTGIFVVGNNGHVYSVDAQNGEVLWENEEHDRRVNNADMSPDGSLIATASSDQTVSIIDTASGETVKKFENFDGPVNDIHFSHLGNKLLISANGHSLSLLLSIPSYTVQE